MRNALRIASGIFASRIFGFLRDAAAAAVFGAGAHGDVLRAVLRLPNLLQNLLGEQSLSAAFIPGLSRQLAAGDRPSARRFAGTVLGLLLAVGAALALTGVVLARPVVALFSPGYLRDAAAVAAGTVGVDRLELAAAALRWTFPMAAVLVLAAWALSVLNSGRRFLLPYLAPVFWNLAILGALAGAALAAGWRWGAGPLDAGSLDRVLLAACAGGFVGAILQFGVQLPGVGRVLGPVRPSWDLGAPGVGTALRSFGPLVLGRGAVQIASYLDLFLASLLVAGAQSALGWAQTLYLLPLSLFAVSVSAAELPELARSGADRSDFTARAGSALARIGYLVVPTAVGFLVLGRPLVAAVYQRGNFEAPDTLLVAGVLAAYAIGLPAAAWSRLLQNVYFALDDTRRPARVAVTRVLAAALMGVPAMLLLDRHAVPGAGTLHWGALGLALASGVAAWLEILLLRRGLRARLPEFRLPWRRAGVFFAFAVPAVALAALATPALGGLGQTLRGIVLVVLYAGIYLAATAAARVPEARGWWGDGGR